MKRKCARVTLHTNRQPKKKTREAGATRCLCQNSNRNRRRNYIDTRTCEQEARVRNAHAFSHLRIERAAAFAALSQRRQSLRGESIIMMTTVLLLLLLLMVKSGHSDGGWVIWNLNVVGVMMLLVAGGVSGRCRCGC